MANAKRQRLMHNWHRSERKQRRAARRQDGAVDLDGRPPRGIGRRLRARYPSWFRYGARDRYDTPTLNFFNRIYPSDGTRDAPMDAESNRFFWRIAIGIVVVGTVLIVLAVMGR